MNQKPTINITQIVDGLKVSLNGSAIVTDGTISSLSIKWGDENNDNIYGNDYSNIEISHVYPNPAIYTIIITAMDNEGDSTTRSIPVSVDFKETSLSNKEKHVQNIRK